MTYRAPIDVAKPSAPKVVAGNVKTIYVDARNRRDRLEFDRHPPRSRRAKRTLVEPDPGSPLARPTRSRGDREDGNRDERPRAPKCVGDLTCWYVAHLVGLAAGA